MAENNLSKQYVYILIDTDFEEFYDVFCVVFATEEAANEEADRLCNTWYKDYTASRRQHFKIRKEEGKN